MTAGLTLMKSVLTPLAKSILLKLGLSLGISVADAAIQTKIYGSGSTASIILNKEMEDITKIFKLFDKLFKLFDIKNETKKEDVLQC